MTTPTWWSQLSTLQQAVAVAVGIAVGAATATAAAAAAYAEHEGLPGRVRTVEERQEASDSTNQAELQRIRLELERQGRGIEYLVCLSGRGGADPARCDREYVLADLARRPR